MINVDGKKSNISQQSGKSDSPYRLMLNNWVVGCLHPPGDEKNVNDGRPEANSSPGMAPTLLPLSITPSGTYKGRTW